MKLLPQLETDNAEQISSKTSHTGLTPLRLLEAVMRVRMCTEKENGATGNQVKLICVLVGMAGTAFNPLSEPLYAGSPLMRRYAVVDCAQADQREVGIGGSPLSHKTVQA